MELLRGGELRYHLMRGLRCKEDMVRFWAAQITLALEGLHERGIVHRDVKPENMIFNDKGTLAK
jgi:serine/threonine protein kinase